MPTYQELLVDGGTYATPEPDYHVWSAYYHEPTGWHLELIDDSRFHLVVGGDGAVWSLPVAICGGDREIGELCWDLASLTDWTIADLSLSYTNPIKPYELVVRDSRQLHAPDDDWVPF